MKKNLVSIVILALVIVNVVLTAIMMFSVTSTSRKTSALVDNITTALHLELAANGNGEDTEKVVVPMSDIDTYDISEKMTIPVKLDADGNSHFFIASITLSMNKKDKGYKKYGTDLAARESLIKSEINDVFAGYTIEEVRDNQDKIREEILEKIQTLFDSEFIFNVAFGDIMYQ